MRNSNFSILHRNDLDEKLSKAIKSPLTIVTAPMGYGKTTAVRGYLDTLPAPVLWTTMAEAVRIARSEYFWLLLLSEISNHYPDFAKNLENRGFPNDSAQIFRLVDLLIKVDRTTTDNIIIVLDDYYLIENQQINELIERVTLADVPWLKVMILSRRVPNIPVDEMASKNLCSIISFTDLTFSCQDALDYFQLIGFKGTDEVKLKIYQESNGWIASMYLMSKNYFDGHPLESIKNMIRTSLFDKYDVDTQNILVRLSLLNSVSPKQAAFIFEDNSIVILLEQLQVDNALISVDEKGNYKFHQIFLNFLRDEQPKYSLCEKEIYRRAGDWFSLNNDLVMSFHYRMLSEDYDLILSELEVADISRVNSLDRKLIFLVFSQISSDKIYEYPLATLKYAFLLILFDEKIRSIKIMGDLETYYENHTHTSYSQDQILAEIELMRTTLCFNDMTNVILHSKQAYERLDGKFSLIRKRNSVFTYGCPHFSYMYYKDVGGYANLIQEIRGGFRYHIDATDGCGSGAIELVIAEHLFETGQLDDVELHANRSRYYAKQKEQTCIIVASMFLLARLYNYTGRTDDLNQIIEEMEAMRLAELNPLNSNVLDNALGYIYVSLGDLDKVPPWLLQGDNAAYISTYQGTGFNYVVYQMSLISLQKYTIFIKNKTNFQLQFNKFNTLWGLVLYHINHSIAQYHTSGIEMAVLEMQKALDIAVQDHLTILFAENAAEVLPILHSGMLNTEKIFLKEIIESCERNMTNAIRQTPSSILSAREVEILELLEEGISTKGIADRLYITQNTAKRHLQNIYRKFDVHNKTLAIKIFRDLEKDSGETNRTT